MCRGHADKVPATRHRQRWGLKRPSCSQGWWRHSHTRLLRSDEVPEEASGWDQASLSEQGEGNLCCLRWGDGCPMGV